MELIEHDIIANGIRLHIYRTGTNKPPLVFAHGITDNGLCFWPFAQQLAADFEIILYDSRGHGKSEAPQTSATRTDRAHDLAGLVKALELHKPGLVGHSMGAVTVSLCAGLYPDLPGRVVLEDPPPFEMMAAPAPEHMAEHLAGRARWRAMAISNKQKSLEELITLCQVESPLWPEAERTPWALSKQQFSLTVFDEDYLDAETGNHIVAQITCPMLLITGDNKLGAIYPLAAADALCASSSVLRHTNIPGAGHNIRRDQPAAYLNAVRNFLNSI